MLQGNRVKNNKHQDSYAITGYYVIIALIMPTEPDLSLETEKLKCGKKAVPQNSGNRDNCKLTISPIACRSPEISARRIWSALPHYGVLIPRLTDWYTKTKKP